MSAEIRNMGDGVYFVDWGNVRIGGSSADLLRFAEDINAYFLSYSANDRLVRLMRDRAAGLKNGLDDGPPNSIIRS